MISLGDCHFTSKWSQLQETSLLSYGAPNRKLSSLPTYYIHRNINRPRWLFSRGHTDKARQILANLHSVDKNLHSPVVELEMAEIAEKVKLDGADSKCCPCSTMSLLILIQRTGGTSDPCSEPGRAGTGHIWLS